MFGKETHICRGAIPVQNMKKGSSHFKSILSAKNPDASRVSPRSGNYFNMKVPECKPFASPSKCTNYSYKSGASLRSKSVSNHRRTSVASKAASDDSVLDASSREHQINNTIEGSNYKASPALQKSSSSMVPFNNMLAVTISCVMLMASRASDIPEEYLAWAEGYLKCFKDREENHPPNIEGILKHIKYLQNNNNKSRSETQCSTIYSYSNLSKSESVPVRQFNVKKFTSTPGLPQKQSLTERRKSPNRPRK